LSTLFAHLGRLDFTTLYACHALLCLVAGFSFLLLRPAANIPGLRWIAANFFLDELFLVLLLQQNQRNSPAVYVLSDLIVLMANYCYYLGFARLIGVRPHLKSIRILFAATLLGVLYAILIEPNFLLRQAFICVGTAPMHLLLAVQAGHHMHRSRARKLLAAMELIMGTGAAFQGVRLLASPAISHATTPLPVQSVLLFLQLFHEGAASLCGFLAVSEHVTREAEHWAVQDTLPGILNRKGIEKELAALLQPMHRNSRKLVLALLDLDHFKKINDEFGHPAGDAALVELANCLTARMRPCDKAGRFGGDEFLILLPDATPDYAQQILDSVRTHVSNLPTRPFTLSGGGTIATFNDTAETMLARADEMLYQAKRDGRNRICIA
jgi:diguanylate cyclase (GGDEF)-like protein